MSLLAFSRHFRSLQVSRSLVKDVVSREGGCGEISKRLAGVQDVSMRACTSALSWQTLIIYAINAGAFIKHVRFMGRVANNTVSRGAHNDARLGDVVARIT